MEVRMKLSQLGSNRERIIDNGFSQLFDCFHHPLLLRKPFSYDTNEGLKDCMCEYPTGLFPAAKIVVHHMQQIYPTYNKPR